MANQNESGMYNKRACIHLEQREGGGNPALFCVSGNSTVFNNT